MDAEVLEKRAKVLDKALEMAIELEGSVADGKPLSRSMVKYLKLAYIQDAEKALADKAEEVRA